MPGGIFLLSIGVIVSLGGLIFGAVISKEIAVLFLLAILNCVLDASGDAAPYNGARS